MDLIAELRRRNVVRMAGLYLVGAWLVVQVADTVLPAFGVPDWVLRGVIVLLAVGFLPALLLAWAFELTPDGIVADAQADPARDQARAAARRMNVAIAVVLAVGVAWFGVDRYVHAQRDDAVATGAQPTGSQGREHARPSIAVLPFEDMSEHGDQGYFADGLSEEVLNQLARVPQLRVVARTSSFSFRGRQVDVATIGEALGVAHVLEGSVRRAGDRLRINAQLVRAGDDTHLWSRSYDRTMADVFAVQDEISRDIVAALRVELLPDQRVGNTQRTSDPAAYEAFLRGTQAQRRAGEAASSEAIAALEEAVALDPGYSNAHAALALAYNVAADYAPDEARRSALFARAFEAAGRAVAIAPDQAAGYAARGTLRNLVDWNWDGARGDFERALAHDPNDPATLAAYSHLLFFAGRHVEAIDMLRRAAALDPLSGSVWFTLGVALAHDGRTPEAIDALQRASALTPGANWPEFYLGFLALQDGRVEEARLHFARAPEPYRLAGVAMLEHTVGDAPASRAALDALQQRYAVGFAYQVAQVHAWRGEHDDAFAWLRRGLEVRDYGLTRMRVDPILAGLRDDPRFAALAAEVGIPE